MKSIYIMLMILLLNACEETTSSNVDDASFSSSSFEIVCEEYQTLSIDPQVEAQCQSAHAYLCGGNMQGVRAACELYNDYENMYDIPSCQYCDTKFQISSGVELSSSSERGKQDEGFYVDPRDGKSYSWKRYNGLVWMTKNLDYNSSQSTCLAGDQSKCSKYGRLYYWNEAQNICPEDWTLSTYKEWQSLSQLTLDYYYKDGNPMECEYCYNQLLMSEDSWLATDDGLSYTDEPITVPNNKFKFNAKAGGALFWGYFYTLESPSGINRGGYYAVAEEGMNTGWWVNGESIFGPEYVKMNYDDYYLINLGGYKINDYDNNYDGIPDDQQTAFYIRCVNYNL